MFARNGEHRLMQLLTKKSTSLGTKSRHYKFTGTSILQHDRQAVKRALTLPHCLKLSLFPSASNWISHPSFCLVHSACVLRAFFVAFFYVPFLFAVQFWVIWWRRCTRHGVPVSGVAACGFLCNFSKCVVNTSDLPSREVYECENNTYLSSFQFFM